MLFLSKRTNESMEKYEEQNDVLFHAAHCHFTQQYRIMTFEDMVAKIVGT